LFVRDIENKVFQGIVLQCLSRIEGITLIEGNIFDSFLGRTGLEGNVKGILAEQDNKNHAINIKVEVNICYGYSIPQKAEEMQTKITEDITRLTGLHVACVHVVIKNVVSPDQLHKREGESPQKADAVEEEYTDEF